MARYEVKAQRVVRYTVEVDADDEGHAMDLAEEIIEDGGAEVEVEDDGLDVDKYSVVKRDSEDEEPSETEATADGHPE